MGVVYEAEQTSLGRTVALKVLPFAALMDERAMKRFKNEAQAAARLQHQNIVPVISVGSEKGVHYYAMQFVDGPNSLKSFRSSSGSIERTANRMIPTLREMTCKENDV